MAWFSGFPQNVMKFILAKLKNLCSTESGSMTETFASWRPRPWLLQKKPTTMDTNYSGTK